MIKSKPIIAVSLAVLAIISVISIVSYSSTGDVMGYVKDEAGNPINGSLVREINESSGSEVGNYTTGARWILSDKS
ncbi:MAG: hypothetical protein DRN20_06045 [Thermoplasmata archaeon]|nr:MAG: hypothetical protein DRN20_06045 [Thermoplasmata archaeon]